MSAGSVLLVVEDEPFIRISIADALQAAGYHVLEAEDAAGALHLLESHPGIQVVFSDIDLGSSIDGVELLQMISDRWPPIRLFATSGRATMQTIDQLPSGATFFPKPYNDKEVVGAFRMALSG